MTDKEELTRGDALAKVAVLEAELAELRKRVCVQEGWKVERDGAPIYVKPIGGAGVWLYPDGEAHERVMWAYFDALLAATPAPAPVERVDQEALRRRFDEIEREICEGKHTAASVFTQMRTAAFYAAPQPAPTACTGKNCGSTDPKLHSADCVAEHEQAIAPAAFLSADASAMRSGPMSKPEVVARLLTWTGPRHEPAPWEGVCARTFTEFPLENPFHGYWKEGEALISLTDYESLQAASAADKARIVELVEALESMTCAYRMAIQAGHARITALGGDCDSVDQMLADFPDYGRSVELYKSCRAALAQQGKECET